MSVINFLTPENWLMEGLKKVQENIKEHNILINSKARSDLIVCWSDSQMPKLNEYLMINRKAKVINYLWDLYSFQDYENDHWKAYKFLLEASTDIWTPTYDVSQDLKQRWDLHSYVLPCFFPTEEWQDVKITTGDYAVQASRRDDYKRFDWFEKACKELKIPFYSCHPDKYSREEYKKILAGCKFLVVSSLEESQGTMSAMEAAYLGKPILMSDCIEGGKEIWGNEIQYFKWDNYERYKEAIESLNFKPLDFLGANTNYSGNTERARERLLKNHNLDLFTENLRIRLKQLNEA